MRPSRIREITVDRSPGGSRFDRQAIRSIMGVTPFRLSDAKLDKRIVAAARHIERKTGLKLFPGTYSAEFLYERLLRNGNYADKPVMIPGLAPAVTSIKIGSTVITADITDRSPDGDISLAIRPNARGWFDGYDGGGCPSVIVEFTAGSTIPDEMQELVGITGRWHYDSQKEDQMILQEQFPLWQMRDEE